MAEAVERTTVTPVLSSKVGYLADIRDQIMTLFRFVIMNPGFTSSLWEDYLISFRTMSAELEADREYFVNSLQRRVIDTLSRMFNDYAFDGQFKSENYDKDGNTGRYKVIFSVFYGPKMLTEAPTQNQMEPGIISGTVTVDQTTNEILLTYDKTVETTSLVVQ